MKAFLYTVIGIAGFIALVFMWWTSTYNRLVAEREDVNQSWGQVQNVYQRRADLIPNLVEVVKGYAKHESAVFTEVTEARSRVGSLNVANLPTDPEAQKVYIEAQRSLSGALGRLIAVAENYPTLKASENFLTLQSQIEGAENRVAVEREKNQRAIASYNKDAKGFFASIVAKHYEFAPCAYYEAQAGSEATPKVKF